MASPHYASSWLTKLADGAAAPPNETRLHARGWWAQPPELASYAIDGPARTLCDQREAAGWASTPSMGALSGSQSPRSGGPFSRWKVFRFFVFRSARFVLLVGSMHVPCRLSTSLGASATRPATKLRAVGPSRSPGRGAAVAERLYGLLSRLSFVVGEMANRKPSPPSGCPLRSAGVEAFGRL